MLPLPIKKHQKIAVIGSNAQFANISGGGSASMKPTYAVTPLQGVKQVAADSEMDVTYEPGVQTHLYQPLLDPWVEGAFHIDFFLTDPAANKTVQPVWSLDYDTSIALMVRVRRVTYCVTAQMQCAGRWSASRHCSTAMLCTDELHHDSGSYWFVGIWFERSVGHLDFVVRHLTSANQPSLMLVERETFILMMKRSLITLRNRHLGSSSLIQPLSRRRRKYN